MAVVTNPSFAISMDAVGNIDGNFTFNSQALGALAINWPALLQWLTTYGPNMIAAIAALIAMFGLPTPPPVAPTVPSHEVKP